MKKENLATLINGFENPSYLWDIESMMALLDALDTADGEIKRLPNYHAYCCYLDDLIENCLFDEWQANAIFAQEAVIAGTNMSIKTAVVGEPTVAYWPSQDIYFIVSKNEKDYFFFLENDDAMASNMVS